MKMKEFGPPVARPWRPLCFANASIAEVEKEICMENLGILQFPPPSPSILNPTETPGSMPSRVRLHQTLASMLLQLCDDACDSVLIENNGVAPEWGCNLFSSDSNVFNENRIASVLTELSQR